MEVSGDDGIFEKAIESTTQASITNPNSNGRTNSKYGSNLKQHFYGQSHSLDFDTGPYNSEDELARHLQFDSEIIDAAEKITYITNHIKNENDYEEVYIICILNIFLTN